jgi:uncharacterized protein YkwD
MRHRILPLLVLLPALAVGACTSDFDRNGSIFTGSAAAGTGKFSAAAAAELISSYRANRGLPPVRLDPRLMKIAQDHANRMASANRLQHVLPGEGSFQRRLAAGDFKASLAAENIAAGQKTLSEVLESWRNSRGHDSNMLKPGVSLIGIANAYTSQGDYKIYWSLVLAEPYVPPANRGGPNAGPIVGQRGAFGWIFGP